MYYYIVNPAAGSGAIADIQEKLKAKLRETGIDGEFNKTIGVGDATKIAKLAVEKGFKTIVVIGGDETVNEVITAVHTTNKPNIAVGIIPTGKQNLMARHLGIGDWQHACEVLSTRRLQSYQLMRVNNKTFIYDCTLISEGAFQPTPSSPSPIWQSLLEQATARPPEYKPFNYLLDLDSKCKLRGSATQITVSNQKFLDTKLENKLIIHLYNAVPSQQNPRIKHWLSKFIKPKSLPTSYSQLHGLKAKIECDSPTDAIIDGAKVGGAKFSLELSNEEILLITNRDEASDH